MNLEVAYVSDDNYIPYAGISILSLLENNKDFDNINIHIIDLGITENNKIKLKNMVTEYNCNIEFIYVNVDNFYEKLGIPEDSSNPCYVDLFLHDLLPDLNKVLYLDCDSVVVGSFKELWSEDISDYYLAGGLEIKLTLNTASDAKKVLGMDENDPYINAGLLLINLDKMREDHINERYLDFIKTFPNIIYFDQDTMNAVLKDNIKILDLKYNFFPEFSKIGYENVIKWTENKCYYSKEEFENAKEDIVFIHYQLGLNGRPWFKGVDLPYSDIFDYYASLSPWDYEEIYTDESVSLKHKILGIFVYKLPFSIFLAFLRLMRKIKKLK